MRGDQFMYNQQKHEWYGLGSAERVELVLKLIDQGHTADELNDYFDVKTKRVITDFMNARGYSKQGDKFVPKGESGAVTTPRSRSVATRQQQDIINFDEKTAANMINLANKHDKLIEIINWYENREQHPEAASDFEDYGHIIEMVDTSLPIPEVEGEIKRTTLRINETILNEFNELWRSKFSEYKQHDLLATALKMFVDKYK